MELRPSDEADYGQRLATLGGALVVVGRSANSVRAQLFCRSAAGAGRLVFQRMLFRNFGAPADSEVLVFD